MNKNQNNFIIICKSLLPTFVAIIIQAGVAFLAQIIVTIKVNIDYSKMASQAGGNTEFLSEEYLLGNIEQILRSPDFLGVMTFLSFLVLVTVFAAWFTLGGYNKNHSRITQALAPRNIIIILITGFLLQIGTSVFLDLLLPCFPKLNENYSALMESLVGDRTLFYILSIVLLAPIAEELIFRGVTLGASRSFWPLVPVITLQAFLFGFYHLNIVQGVYAFICGLFLGYTAYKLNNLLASILLHAAINGSSFLLSQPDLENVFEIVFENRLLSLLIGTVCFIIAFSLMSLLKLPESELSGFSVPSDFAAEKINSAFGTDNPLSRVDFSAPVRTPDLLGDISDSEKESEKSEKTINENIDVSEK